MNAELKQELIDWGVNWEEVKERLVGNEDLVEKFILKFLKDPSMERLQNGLERLEQRFGACAGVVVAHEVVGKIIDLARLLRELNLGLVEKTLPAYGSLVGETEHAHA